MSCGSFVLFVPIHMSSSVSYLCAQLLRLGLFYSELFRSISPLIQIPNLSPLLQSLNITVVYSFHAFTLFLFGVRGPAQLLKVLRFLPPLSVSPSASLPLYRTDFPRLMQVWPRSAAEDADGREGTESRWIDLRSAVGPVEGPQHMTRGMTALVNKSHTVIMISAGWMLICFPEKWFTPSGL